MTRNSYRPIDCEQDHLTPAAKAVIEAAMEFVTFDDPASEYHYRKLLEAVIAYSPEER